MIVLLTPSVTVRAGLGMVCSPDHLASGAGVEIMRAGGNAVDAAIAASAVLAVTSQHMCGLGGDLFALVHDGDGPPLALNASGRAGSGADPASMRARGHRVMPLRGDVRSAPVPGVIDGWSALHARAGALPLSAVLAPAVRYGAEGFPASVTLAASWERIRDVPGSDDYLDAAPIEPGTIICRPGAAAVLADLADGGREAVFGGDYGRDLLDVGVGEYSRADLDIMQADWVEPLSVEAFGTTIWTVPPNSQGYLALAATSVAAALGLPEDVSDPAWAHLMVEAAKQVGHDRAAVLHDRADGRALLAPDRLQRAIAAIDHDRAAPLSVPADGGGTIYLCAVDEQRRGVSLIQSNASGWGAHLVLPRTRIFLHDRGIGFSLRAGHPAEYGPGRRPPHTLAPTLVTETDGRLRAVVGTMGGDAQPQIVQQLLVRLLGHGETPATAIASGRWMLSAPDTNGFDTWADPSGLTVAVEGHAPSPWASGLADRGHRVDRRAPWPSGFGHAHAIVVEGDHLAGAADPRALGSAAHGF